MVYTVLAYSVFTICMDAKVMPTDDTKNINHKTYSINHIGSTVQLNSNLTLARVRLAKTRHFFKYTCELAASA